MTDDYETGYGQPPKHTRYKKGQSGNPKGRPKGTKNLETDLLEELGEMILVREGNRSVRISKQRAMIKNLTMKALKGDTRATEIILKRLLLILEKKEPDQTEDDLSAEDNAILNEAMNARIASDGGGSRDDG